MKTFVMTGATTGIGAAVRSAIEARGDKVVNIDIKGGDINVDLATDEGRQTALAEVRAQHPDGIDGWIPCAGLGPQFRDHATIVSVNFYHVRVMTEALEDLLRKKLGVTVLIASNSAPIPGLNEELVESMAVENDEAKTRELVRKLDGFNAYAGSKLALVRWMRPLATRWAAEGMRINAIAPGTTDTPLLQAGLDDEIFGNAIRNFKVPIGKFARPEQVAKGVLFLAGDDADYCIGSVLFVDGGSDALIRPNGF